MFTDARSKRVIFVAHCLLNQNSISDGTADYPGVNEAILQTLLKARASYRCLVRNSAALA